MKPLRHLSRFQASTHHTYGSDEQLGLHDQQHAQAFRGDLFKDVHDILDHLEREASFKKIGRHRKAKKGLSAWRVRAHVTGVGPGTSARGNVLALPNIGSLRSSPHRMSS